MTTYCDWNGCDNHASNEIIMTNAYRLAGTRSDRAR